jgi:hypothetical protein
MVSNTPTLLDPFELGRSAIHRAPLSTLDEVTEWFNQAATFEEIALLQELNTPPPWTPEPVDRRWRARGWEEDSLD